MEQARSITVDGVEVIICEEDAHLFLQDNSWFRDLTCYGIYDPNFEPMSHGSLFIGSEDNEDETCDRLEEIDREAEFANQTTIYLPLDFSVDMSELGHITWVEEPATQSACNHSRLTESGFGSAFCCDCPAVLRRDDQLNWVVVR